jgi:adenine-specific DNA-methyltransferase
VRGGAKVNRARELRTELTDVERRLWFRLRDRRLFGWKFRRQVPIGPFIVDFACAEHRLIIELDGGQHTETVDEDDRRTTYIEKRGWRVVRFWNSDVIENLDGVLEAITMEIEAITGRPHDAPKSPHPGPLP